MTPKDWRIYEARARLRVKVDRHEEAVSVFAELLAIDPNNPITHYNAACVYSRMGDLEMSLTFLKSAIAHGFNDKTTLQSDPDLDNLRGTDGFTQLVHDMN